ncbi:MAG TPA: serine hydrolase domain-containing protein [Chitinophagaceae bacterium]|nr:serine hydrolase domain-containing protein [Chitinophagaceae bacterium]
MRILLALFLAAFLFFCCRNKETAFPETEHTPLVKANHAVDESMLKLLATRMPLVDSIIIRHVKNSNIPGFAYGVVLNGTLIHAGSGGVANIKENILVSSNTAFRIASMTKSFTTMAILILRDQGKLNLDDQAVKYVPEMANLKYLTTDAPVITIRDLMTHRAGFPEDNPYGDRQLSDTDAELMDLIRKGPSFSNVAGIRYEYSNLGISLLGTIIKNITGQPYQQFIAENIFKPLGMNHTYWEYTKVPSNELAHGYRWINNMHSEEELLHDGAWGAMGGLLTTIDDFAKYMSVHLNAWPARNGNESAPLKRSSIREMHQMWNVDGMNINFSFPSGRACPIVAGYGFGLGIVKDCESRIFVGHGGGLPGFGSHWRILPEYGLGIAIFSNRTYAGWGGITMQLLDTLVALTGLKPYPVRSQILEQRKNELMQFLPHWKDAEKSSIFAENFFPDNPIDTLRKISAALFEKAGTIKEVTAMSATNNLRGYFDVIGEKSKLRVYFTLSPEHDPTIQAFDVFELKDDQ